VVITVVLPAYNEAEALPRLLARLQVALNPLSEPSRIVVVDDGSNDGTADTATAAAGSIPVEVVRHSHNRGLNLALDTGFRYALAASADRDLIVTMDADDTHPPDLISVMVDQVAAGRDLVIASRFRHLAEWHGKTWDRILFSYTVSWMFRAVMPMPGVKDYTCGYRMYRADLLRRGYERWGDALLGEPSFACMPDLLLKLRVFRPSIGEAPLVLHYDRKAGPSKMAVARTIRRTLLLLGRHRLGRC
jgi:dolichol-phosphate mannosyltransferase